MDESRERLGDPDLKLAGFQLWVHGPETAPPNTDKDWLSVTAHCGAHGASVWASGALVQRADLAGWIGSVGLLYRELSGSVRLAPLEQNLSIMLHVSRSGAIEVVVEITPDPRNERHHFQFDIDQSYLPPFLEQGRKLLDRHPRPRRPAADPRPAGRVSTVFSNRGCCGRGGVAAAAPRLRC